MPSRIEMKNAINQLTPYAKEILLDVITRTLARNDCENMLIDEAKKELERLAGEQDIRRAEAAFEGALILMKFKPSSDEAPAPNAVTATAASDDDDIYGDTPAATASVTYNDGSAAKKLENDSYSLFQLAAQQGHKEIIEILFSKMNLLQLNPLQALTQDNISVALLDPAKFKRLAPISLNDDDIYVDAPAASTATATVKPSTLSIFRASPATTTETAAAPPPSYSYGGSKDDDIYG